MASRDTNQNIQHCSMEENIQVNANLSIIITYYSHNYVRLPLIANIHVKLDEHN